MSPVLISSVLLQVGFFLVQDLLPAPHPIKISKAFTKLVGVLALIMTLVKVSAINLLLNAGALSVSIALLAIAISAPVAGILENRLRADGDKIFAPSRFLGHLTTNVFGALAASAFVWSAANTERFDTFNKSFGDEAAFNIALPLATAVALAFARSEQEKRSGGLDLKTSASEEVEPAIIGHSLRHVHQILNTVHLIVVVFVAGATMLYLFAQAITSAKDGDPLTVSWPVITAISFTLLFFLSCGLPTSRESPTVWMTFTTGAPAAMGLSLIWLALFEDTPLRNVVMVIVLGAAYTAYCIELVLAEKRRSGRIEIHYFTSVVVLFSLSMLLGSVYLS